MIGEGTYGTVILRDKYAVKMAKLEAAHAINEITLLRVCNSEHVVRPNSWVISENEVTITFDQYDCDYAAYLRENTPSEGECVSHAVDILKGLSYIHSRGIIHCDIKPANILMRDGRLSLCDFGMATLNRVIAVPVQTARYRAPEVPSEGGPVHLTPKIDVWSFGIMFIEMLTGTTLQFDDEDAQANACILLQVDAFEKRSDTTKLLNKLSDDYLCRVISRAMAVTGTTVGTNIKLLLAASLRPHAKKRASAHDLLVAIGGAPLAAVRINTKSSHTANCGYKVNRMTGQLAHAILAGENNTPRFTTAAVYAACCLSPVDHWVCDEIEKKETNLPHLFDNIGRAVDRLVHVLGE